MMTNHSLSKTVQTLTLARRRNLSLYTDMAQNRRPEAEARDGSSSEEEESSEEIEEPESEYEEEEEKDKSLAPSIKKPLPSRLKKLETAQALTQPKISSSDESESESPKPLASKPMEEPPKPRYKVSSVTPVAKSTKRPVESESKNIRESKRVKKRLEEDADRVPEEDTAKKMGDDSKRQLFQRLWSEEDEIAILKGMAEYKAKKGADPATEMNAFHDFIKKSLHVEVSKIQLSDKVRRLKKKFENNFKKSHEQLVYEWSKKIWAGGDDDDDANGGAVGGTKLVDGKASKMSRTKMAVEASSVSRSGIDKLGLDVDDIFKDGLELIIESKRVGLEEKWRKFRIKEFELYLRRLDLNREKAKLVLEALESSSGNEDS